MAKFSRDMRMNSPRDYSRVFRQAKHVGGGGLTILSVENTVGHPRLGLAIAKKHLKLATQRNRLKRLIRESFRHHQATFANIDIVVLSRTDIKRREVSKIRAALAQHWITLEAQWKES